MFDRAVFILYQNSNVNFRGQLLSIYKSEFDHFGLFRFLWFLAFHWHINFKIWISFDWSIWRFPVKCSFRGFSDIWFSIIHSKSISYPKIKNSISINSIFFSSFEIYNFSNLVTPFWFSDFTEHLLLVKVNALTLTFNFYPSNLRFQFLKLLIRSIYIISIHHILFLLP